MCLMKTTSGVARSCAVCPGEETGVSGAWSHDSAGQPCNQTHELGQGEGGERGRTRSQHCCQNSSDTTTAAPLISITQYAITLQLQPSLSRSTHSTSDGQRERPVLNFFLDTSMFSHILLKVLESLTNCLISAFRGTPFLYLYVHVCESSLKVTDVTGPAYTF